MLQGLLNILLGIYAVVSSIVIGYIYRYQLRVNSAQIEFNNQVIEGFTLTRKVLTK